METTCEASFSWHRQENFRRVCPLLQRNAAGQLRCSVNTPDVRPFWLRALGIYTGAGLAVYITATVALFSVLRAVDYQISYATVAWPPKWAQHRQVRSDYFAAKAQRALARKDPAEALISYSLAYTHNPQNFHAGFAYAQLAQLSQPALSDQIYAQLLREHADRRVYVLTAWYQNLLLRGDFKTIVPLATDALKLDSQHSGAWLHALLFALSREPDDAALRTRAKDTAIPAGPRAVLAMEQRIRSLPTAAARAALLNEPAAPADPYFEYFRPKRLIDLGFPADALTLLNRMPTLNTRDRVLLKLHADAALGRTDAVRAQVEALLAGPITAPVAELLAVHFVAHPDQALFRSALAALQRDVSAARPENFGMHAMFLCAAGACGDLESVRSLSASLRQMSNSPFKSLDAVEAFFRQTKTDTRIEHILPVLQPLSIGLNYALLERYYRPRASTAAASAK
jgi:hypothetical protein